MAYITINYNDTAITDCSELIAVSTDTSSFENKVRIFGAAINKQKKHTLHAICQMAYYQYQDDEIHPVLSSDPIQISHEHQQEILTDCLIIFRSDSKPLEIIVNGDITIKKSLEEAHKYCTRWIRLDI